MTCPVEGRVVFNIIARVIRVDIYKQQTSVLEPKSSQLTNLFNLESLLAGIEPATPYLVAQISTTELLGCSIAKDFGTGKGSW